MRDRKEVENDIQDLKNKLHQLENECPVLVGMTLNSDPELDGFHRLVFNMSGDEHFFVRVNTNSSKSDLIDALESIIKIIKGE